MTPAANAGSETDARIGDVHVHEGERSDHQHERHHPAGGKRQHAHRLEHEDRSGHLRIERHGGDAERAEHEDRPDEQHAEVTADAIAEAAQVSDVPDRVERFLDLLHQGDHGIDQQREADRAQDADVHVRNEADEAGGDFLSLLPEGREQVLQDRLDLVVDTEGLQHRERERQERHHRQQRRVDEAHRPQSQVPRDQVADQDDHQSDRPQRARFPQGQQLVPGRPDRPLDAPQPVNRFLLHAMEPRARRFELTDFLLPHRNRPVKGSAASGLRVPPRWASTVPRDADSVPPAKRTMCRIRCPPLSAHRIDCRQAPLRLSYRHATFAALHRPPADRDRRFRLRCGSARRRADAAVVRPRPRHPVEPDRLDRPGAAVGADPDRVDAADRKLLQPDAAGRAALRHRSVSRRAQGADRHEPVSPGDPLRRPRDLRRRRAAHAALDPRPAAPRDTSRRQRSHAGCAAGARPRHELRRTAQRRDPPVPVLLLPRAGREHRPHHRGDRAAVVARLGAGFAGAAARRGHRAFRRNHGAGVAPDRARPARAHP